MELASTLYHNTSYLRSINRVRSQFNVVNMSDITTSNGKALDKRFLFRKEVCMVICPKDEKEINQLWRKLS